MKIRIIGTLTGLLLPLATIGFAGVAQAQAPSTAQYPPRSTTVTVNRTEVPAGGVVEVSGTADPNSTVTFSLPARVLGTALTNNAGAFRAGVTIPCDVSGTQTLTTTGPGINASTTLNVVGATDACVGAADTARTAPAGGNLPRTGSSSTAPLTAAGIGLVLIGAATAVTSRRRRKAENATA